MALGVLGNQNECHSCVLGLCGALVLVETLYLLQRNLQHGSISIAYEIDDEIHPTKRD